MSATVSIDYQVGRNGWSQFRLTVGTTSIVVGPFGYCTDALGDLVRAALMIATSGSRAEVSFDAEPMEWRLIVGSYWDDAQSGWTYFRLRVLTFPYAVYPPSPEAEGHSVFEAQCSTDRFVHAVLRAAEAVWDEYGAGGYDRAWGGPRGFPVRALVALKAAVWLEEP